MANKGVEFFKQNGNHRGYQMFWLIAALIFAMSFFPANAHGQVVGVLEFNVPHSFYVGNTKLPAGTYRIHMLDDSDLTVMEITSADNSTSALFEVEAARTDVRPKKNEVIFNKYGNQYFLSKLFDDGERNGSQVLKSRYETRLIDAAAESKIVQEQVPAHRPGA